MATLAKIRLPCEDQISKSLFSILCTEEIDIAGVFAAQISVDINNIFKENGVAVLESYFKLREDGEAADNALGVQPTDSEDLMGHRPMHQQAARDSLRKRWVDRNTALDAVTLYGEIVARIRSSQQVNHKSKFLRNLEALPPPRVETDGLVDAMIDIEVLFKRVKPGL
jgi:hypothetical protein